MKLSVLDLIPTRSGQTTTDALEVSAAVARLADSLGFERYWVAEHHNMAAVASTVPSVLIPYLANGTSRIRFGSGGVMLPNHSALAVAEQFALLESMYPGRIDLGIGRAPGSDQVTAFLLRGSGGTAVDEFPAEVRLIAQLLGLGSEPGGPIDIDLRGQAYSLRATPQLATAPEVWLLGSSNYSAQLAALMGLPYAFAHHFGSPGVHEALRRYRAEFTETEFGQQPRTLLPVNVIVDPDPEVAVRRAQPQLVQMTELRTSGVVGRQLTIEEAERYEWNDQRRAVADQMSRSWLVGTPAEVAGQLRELAERHDVEEFMLSPTAGAFASELADGPGARAATLELLGAELLQPVG